MLNAFVGGGSTDDKSQISVGGNTSSALVSFYGVYCEHCASVFRQYTIPCRFQPLARLFQLQLPLPYAVQDARLLR